MSSKTLTPTGQALQHEVNRLTAELKSLRDSGVELPEPVAEIDCADSGDYHTEWWGELTRNAHQITSLKVGVKLHTEAQLRDYGDRRAMAEREACATHYLDIMRKAVAAERERAAKVCEREWETTQERTYGKTCAEAIRKGE